MPKDPRAREARKKGVDFNDLGDDFMDSTSKSSSVENFGEIQNDLHSSELGGENKAATRALDIYTANFLWMPFFKELCSVLMGYRSQQSALIEFLHNAGMENGLTDRRADKEFPLKEIDPFTFLALLLKSGDSRNIEYMASLKEQLSISSPLPSSLDGLPRGRGVNVWLFAYADNRGDKDIDLLWDLFAQALNHNIEGDLFNTVLSIRGVGFAKLTQALFLVNPEYYLPVDKQTKSYLSLGHDFIINEDWKNYQKILNYVRRTYEQSFYELSFMAWAKSVGLSFNLPKHTTSERNSEQEYVDDVRMQNDSAEYQDRLNRKGFSSYVADQINELWRDNYNSCGRHDRSLILNVCGAWGSGKTTFVNLLIDQLIERPINNKEWTVVSYNAWKNQHIRPVWWSLLDQFSLASLKNFSGIGYIVNRLKEWWWRFIEGYGLQVTGFLIAVLVLQLIFNSLGSSESFWAQVKAVLSLPTGIAVFVGVIVLTLQAVMVGSSSAAKIFQVMHRDPLQRVKMHFKKVINLQGDTPVVVFIDDLDRCRSDYVVELLECLHTLLSDRRVFYLIAADKAWISSCFEQSYAENSGELMETGRTKGYLFIEKIFQLSISLPAVDQSIKNKFVDYLLGIEMDTVTNNDVFEISEALSDVSTDEEISDIASDLLSRGLDKESVINASVVASATEAVSIARKHRLKRFVNFIEPNPRGIKLLVNAYGIYINLFRLSVPDEISGDVLDQIAYWVIMSVRFPRLADYLEKHPSLIDDFNGSKGLESVPEDIKTIMKNPSVIQLLKGQGVLDEDGTEVSIPMNSAIVSYLLGRKNL